MDSLMETFFLPISETPIGQSKIYFTIIMISDDFSRYTDPLIDWLVQILYLDTCNSGKVTGFL